MIDSPSGNGINGSPSDQRAGQLNVICTGEQVKQISCRPNQSALRPHAARLSNSGVAAAGELIGRLRRGGRSLAATAANGRASTRAVDDPRPTPHTGSLPPPTPTSAAHQSGLSQPQNGNCLTTGLTYLQVLSLRAPHVPSWTEIVHRLSHR